MSQLDSSFARLARHHLGRRGVPAGVSRRQFLRIGAGGAVGLAALGAPARGAFARNHRKLLREIPPRRLGPASRVLDPTLLCLINRITFGFSRTAYDEAETMGYDAFVESQLDYESIDDSALDARLAGYDTLSMSSQQIYDTYQEMQSVPMIQLIEATILRAVYSKRQLFERMVQFWTDHFNIDILDGPVVFLKTADDREVIRQRAMTTFPELLNASARSGAMLFYLDNYANVVGQAQENYARELMELHSLGVDGGYTQGDVEEVARCLTGWTLAGPDQPPLELGDFVFNAAGHDFGSKTVLGHFIPAGGGESDGQTVLDILAYHPNCARFIAHKLCTRFLGYDPPEDVVESVKATYLATRGDIKEMLRVILQQAVLAYLTTPKFKRPFHLVTSLLRSTDAEVTNPLAVAYHLLAMGQVPFFWGPPDGYPDALESWVSSVHPRWQFASLLPIDAIPGASVDTLALLESEGGNIPGEQAAAIDRILTGGLLSDDEVVALQQFYDDVSPTDPVALDDTFGLAASLPGFQWY